MPTAVRSPPPVGLASRTTPPNPTSTALQRRQPTASRNSGTARAVAKSGLAKVIAMASANGRRLSEPMNRKVVATMRAARRACPSRLRTRRSSVRRHSISQASNRPHTMAPRSEMI